jgi:hypothetical protein
MLGSVGCFVAVLLFGIAGSVFWIWALIDCATREPNEALSKIGWIVAIGLTHFIGAVLYVLIRRPERVRTVGR